MIIKSMSRKGDIHHFAQLYKYISQKALKDFSIFHNTQSHNFTTAEDIIKEFQDNAKNLTKSKHRNICYHEILSLKRQKNISLEHYQEIFEDIASKYLNQRAEKQIAYGRLHIDRTNTIHLHLMISSNQLNQHPKRVRLFKKEFWEIQKNIENHILHNFKELEAQPIYTQSKAERKLKREQGKKHSRKEQEIKKRGKTTKKQKLKDILTQIFQNATTQKELQDALKKYKITLTPRGKNITATYENIKSRLETLQITEIYKKCQEKINQYEQNKKDFEKIRDYHRKVEKDMKKDLGDDFDM